MSLNTTLSPAAVPLTMNRCDIAEQAESPRHRLLNLRAEVWLNLSPEIAYRDEDIEILSKALQLADELGCGRLDISIQVCGVYLEDPQAPGTKSLFLRPKLSQEAAALVAAVRAGEFDQACIDWLKAHGGSYAK